MSINHCISDELLAAFIDGKTTQEQSDVILEAFKNNPELFGEFRIAFSAANIVDSDFDNFNSSTNVEHIIPSAIIGHGIFGSLNNFDNSQINTDLPMVAASNNHHNDRIHDLLYSIAETNTHSMDENNVNQVIGDNPTDIVNIEVQQQYSDTCAIKSQQLILNDFGIPITEDQLVQQAETLNIYHQGQGGTSPDDVGKLLEINGVSCTQHENASIYDLTSALAKGEKVIIGVDSGELWDGGTITKLKDSFIGEQADHALIVAGIDTTDPNDVQVILTDPGTGQEGARYPIAQFLDAWHDSGNFMVTTDQPAPLAYNPEMINFDYGMGHLSTIGHLSYDFFDQEILPLSQNIGNELSAINMAHASFLGMVNGEIDDYSIFGMDLSNTSLNDENQNMINYLSLNNSLNYEDSYSDEIKEQIEYNANNDLSINDLNE